MHAGVIRAAALALTMLAAGCGHVDAARAGAPQTDGEAIILGRGFDIVSAALGETRRINIYLPPGHDEGSARYPVLYVIDGGVEQDFIHIAGLSQHAWISDSFRTMIVVGVETKDRRKELAFPAERDATLTAQYPTHGESAKFRQFIADEVKPWVEARYRTDGHDVVIGESLAGLFVLETFLRQPDLFDGYAAIDPSLWWDTMALPRDMRSLLAENPSGARSLYMAAAKGEPAMRAPQDIFALGLKDAPASLTFRYEKMDDEAHSTIYHRAALNALRMLFAKPPAE